MSENKACIIASGKGGTGKTSLVAAIATLMSKCGKKTAVIDMDMGQRSLDIALGLENRVVFDIYDVTRGVCRLKQARITSDELPGVTMISASQVRDAASIDAEKYADMVSTLVEDNDLVLVDAPPGVGEGLKLACSCPCRAIIVVTPDYVSVRNASRAISVMKDLGIDEFGVVLNRVKPFHLTFDYDLSTERIVEWLGIDVIATIRESDMPNPLIGDSGVVKVARLLTDGERLKWPVKKPTLMRRIISALTGTNKRSSNAKSI